MAQPWVPGPAPVYFGGSPAQGNRPETRQFRPAFLGYTDHGVDLLMDPQYAPVVTDAGGRVPTDLIYQGVSATVSLTLTRWRESSYEALANHSFRGAANGGRGQLPSGSIGTVMNLEGASVILYVLFPYAAILDYADPLDPMPFGYRLVNCVLDREGLPERGSKPAKLLLTFRCLPNLGFNYRDGQFPYPDAENEDLWFLYDHHVGDVRGIFPD